MAHMSVRSWADEIGVSRSTAYRWLREGHGPTALRVHGTVRIPRDAADAWEREHLIEGGTAQ